MIGIKVFEIELRRIYWFVSIIYRKKIKNTFKMFSISNVKILVYHTVEYYSKGYLTLFSGLFLEWIRNF